MWDEFYALSSAGKTLFVTTHYMEEAQRCHRLAFISAGKLIANGTPQSMRQYLGDAKVFVSRIPYSPRLRQVLVSLPRVVLINQFGNKLRMVVRTEVSPETLTQTIAQVIDGAFELASVEANLEDMFIALTQGPDKP